MNKKTCGCGKCEDTKTYRKDTMVLIVIMVVLSFLGYIYVDHGNIERKDLISKVELLEKQYVILEKDVDKMDKIGTKYLRTSLSPVAQILSRLDMVEFHIKEKVENGKKGK